MVQALLCNPLLVGIEICRSLCKRIQHDLHVPILSVQSQLGSLESFDRNLSDSDIVLVPIS